MPGSGARVTVAAAHGGRAPGQVLAQARAVPHDRRGSGRCMDMTDAICRLA